MTCFATAAMVLSGFAAVGAPGVHLLDVTLQVPGAGLLEAAPAATAPDLTVAHPASRSLTADQGGGGGREQPTGTQSPQPPDSLDFDLLGAPPPAKPVDEGALRLRRSLLTWHQGVGLGMFALQLATTVVGQLNYDDKFGGANTDKYVQTHAILAFSTLAAFAAAGTLALLAPSPIQRDEGFDRVKLHKIAMVVATAGMAAQGVLGIWTQSREGYVNQQTVATAHLAIGYVTLAAVAAGIGAIVF